MQSGKHCFLIHQFYHMFWVSKEPSLWDGFLYCLVSTWLSENEQQKKSCLFLHFFCLFLLGCHFRPLWCEKNCFLGLQTTKVQTSLLRLIRALLFTNWKAKYLSSFNFLTSLCSWAGCFEHDLVRNEEDRFSCDETHLLQFLVYR